MKLGRAFLINSTGLLLLAPIGCSAPVLATSSPRTIAAAAALQPPGDQVAVPLSDPARPALVQISLVHGSITVRGANRRDVLVIARSDADRSTRRVDPDATGLRRLPQPGGFRITEEANRVTIASDNPSRSIGFDVEVPLRTNLRLKTVNGGEVRVEGVDGEIDVSNTNGGITLTSVAGSVIAGTTNGNVRASLTRVTADKEMAFTSLNGTIDVTLPASTKASLRIRSDHGDVYSDFDVQLKPEPLPAVTENSSARGRYRITRNRSIVGTINGGGPEFEMRTFNSNVYVRKGR
jgi:putative adhesin